VLPSRGLLQFILLILSQHVRSLKQFVSFVR
jgi:hypothetical protein